MNSIMSEKCNYFVLTLVEVILGETNEMAKHKK